VLTFGDYPWVWRTLFVIHLGPAATPDQTKHAGFLRQTLDVEPYILAQDELRSINLKLKRAASLEAVRLSTRGDRGWSDNRPDLSPILDRNLQFGTRCCLTPSLRAAFNGRLRALCVGSSSPQQESIWMSALKSGVFSEGSKGC
jgi:hypothetical protein